MLSRASVASTFSAMKLASLEYAGLIFCLTCTNFMKESFYAKLKKFADEANTNLYVSNIPRNMNEHVRLPPVYNFNLNG